MTQLKKPVQIYHEIINEEPIVEVPKTFKYEKPNGWNKKPKKLSLLKIIWYGINRRVDMEPSEHKRFDNLMSNLKPILIILLLLISGWAIFKYSSVGDKKYNEGEDSNYINRFINFFADKYKHWNDEPSDNQNLINNIDTTHFQFNDETRYIKPIIDTPHVEVQQIINIKPIDTTTKLTPIIDTIKDWEKEYLKLNH